MDNVLETLIATQREEKHLIADMPLKLVDKKSNTWKALIALNIMVTQKVGKQYRLYFLSDLMDREIASTSDLKVCEVYGLLKFIEGVTPDVSKPL